MINKVIIVGTLAKTPEMQYTNSNLAFVSLVVNVEESKKYDGEYKDVTVSIGNINVWGEDRANKVIEEFHAGDLVVVEGRTTSYETDAGKFYNSVNVVSIRKAGSSDKEEGAEEDNVPF